MNLYFIILKLLFIVLQMFKILDKVKLTKMLKSYRHKDMFIKKVIIIIYFFIN